MAMSDTLCITSRADNVMQVCAWVRDLDSALKVTHKTSSQIQLCVVEALNNVIEHAYDDRESGTIQITYTADSDGIRICLRDFGRSFEPVPRSELGDLTMESGRGWFIMRSWMDQVHYKSESGVNILTLEKRIKNLSLDSETGRVLKDVH